ncbi:MAG: hypothetical protein C5B46_04065 [Proteobacteria bacterium]|nr:MAG: hypothetical protein C5B46_04065 [Pseudomonadota bacterium]
MNRARRSSRYGATLLLALACTLPLSSHGDAQHDNPSPFQPSNGGQARMAGPYYLELVARRNEIFVYITDHAGAAVGSAGGKGKAVVHTDGHGLTILLAAADGNVLKGAGRFKLKRSSIVYVTVHLRRAKEQKAVFRPLEGMPVEPSANPN